MSKDLAKNLRDSITILATRNEPEDLLEWVRRLTTTSSGKQITWPDLLSTLVADDAKGGSLQTLAKLVNQWDQVPTESAEWALGTPARTMTRRVRIFEKLGADSQIAEAFTELKPIPEVFETEIGAIPDFWYTPQRQNDTTTYWTAYQTYLADTKHWPAESIEAIDTASTAIIRRLADPQKASPRQSKGLVVGYVQSGKTANFSAVIAKAIDCGYRLIIVLTGMQNQLRQQTQRRLDMELVGVSNILGDLTPAQAVGTPNGEYLDDEAWGSFSRLVKSGVEPSIQRLTTFNDDVDKKAYIGLDFGSYNANEESFSDYVLSQSVKLIVTKKNAVVLKHLNHALKVRKDTLQHIPTLLIDDESDQATPNTAKPNWTDPDAQEHKKINDQIIEMRKLLPRCQYLGYTATPFANVFINPEDALELFPDDYIIALDRPRGYMGARDFIPKELGGSSETDSGAHPHPRVRLFVATGSEAAIRDAMEHALACFVVAGAIKLFRQSKDPTLEGGFRHHTMMIHSSHKKAGHADDQERVRQIWTEIAWKSDHGRELLLGAFTDLQVTMDADDPSMKPADIEELSGYIEECCRRIEEDVDGHRSPKNVAVVVNSDQEFSERLDFNRQSTWKIVVGGNQLSRGFTVEGLTTTWFTRTPRATDTLTQMARWFGYRPGYRDLVRLFLPDVVKIGQKEESLYEAFCAAAREEEEFRSELRKYATFNENETPIRPRDVVPLVYNFLGWMKPAAKNKMHWAIVDRKGDSRFSPKVMSQAAEDLAESWPYWATFLAKAESLLHDEEGRAWFSGVVDVEDVSTLLGNIRWQSGFEATIASHFKHFEYLEKESQLQDFALFLPQLLQDSQTFMFPEVGKRSYSWRKRAGVEGRTKFGEFSEPTQYQLAQNFANLSGPSWIVGHIQPNATRGAILAYPIPDSERVLAAPKKERDKFIAEHGTAQDFTVGLQFFTPTAASAKWNAIAFKVRTGNE